MLEFFKRTFGPGKLLGQLKVTSRQILLTHPKGALGEQLV